MSIDWITVSAQIVNFLILVWLLKRLLYQPVMRAMATREQRITGRLTEAQERERQADEQRQQYQSKVEQLEQQSQQLLAQAAEQAEQEKLKLLDDARTEVNEQLKHWQLEVSQEKEKFLKDLQKLSGDLIQTISRKALRDLAGTELEQQIIDSFIHRLKSLDKSERKLLLEATGPVHIVTSFDLDPAVRGKLTRAVHEYISDTLDTQYTQSEEILCGIELNVGGKRLSMNVNDYMLQLNERVEEAFGFLQSAKE